MDIYRNWSDVLATLSLSNHDVKKLIEALNLDANVCAVRDKYFIDDASYLEFTTPKRWQMMYARRRFHRIPFYKDVYMSKNYPNGYFAISRCVGIDKWSVHSILFGNSMDLIRGYESVFHKI